MASSSDNTNWHEVMNIPGPDHLREALTNCEDPLQAIEEFQEQNSILLPSLKSALHFVDLHGIPRSQFNQTVVDQLREKLLQQIEALAKDPNKNNLKILNDLLAKSFKLVKYKPLQPVTMAILKHLPKIKVEYLQAVLDDKELYKEVATEVKQQIWQDNQTMFGDEVLPLLKQYTDEKDELLYAKDNIRQTFFTLSPKLRRQNHVVQQLTEMVGHNVMLYDMLLQFLRTLFLRSRNVHYCTLRAEMLMALHEAEVTDITSVDPCHKFTWCLDACIRERFVDSKRARELQGFLDSIRKGQEQVLGDLSMILADPYAMHTITSSAIKSMHNLANNEVLPRKDEEIILLLRMAQLGMKAWQMIDSQVFKEAKIDVEVVTRFLPSIFSLMIDDQLNGISTKTHEEILVTLEPVPPNVLMFSKDNPVACLVVMYYVLHACRQKDAVALARLLPIMSQADTDIVYQDIMIHVLVSHLGMMDDCFAYPFFYETIIDEFFVPGISIEHVLKHLIRLMWFIHFKMPGYQLKELLLKIKPNSLHSPVVHDSYKKLLECIDSYHPINILATVEASESQAAGATSKS